MRQLSDETLRGVYEKAHQLYLMRVELHKDKIEAKIKTLTASQQKKAREEMANHLKSRQADAMLASAMGFATVSLLDVQSCMPC